MRPLRAALYLRVSTDRQARAGTIDSQRRDVPARAATEGWSVVRTYVDDGASAATGNLDARPGLLDLLRDATAGAFDVVVVQDLDRLTRADLLERSYILGTLERAGVRVATVTGGVLDLSTVSGEVTALIQSRGAADWLTKHRARTVAGKLTAIERGRKPAGPTPYGYRYSRETGLWTVDEAAAAIVREVFSRVAAGETCTSIAIDFDARDVPLQSPRSDGWQRAAVYRLVRRRTYTGTWVADRRRKLTVAVPAIVTPDQYDAADRVLIAHGKRGLDRTMHTYLLQGLARCGRCGAPIGVASAVARHTRGDGRPGAPVPARYVCSQRRRPAAERCLLPYHPTIETDEAIWSTLVDVVATPGIVDSAIRSLRRQDAPDPAIAIRAARASLDRLDRHERAVVERAGRITPEILDAQLARIAQARTAARNELEAAEAAARNRRVALATTDDLAASIEEVRRQLDTATGDERRGMVQQLVDHVEIGDRAATAALSLPGLALGLASTAGSSWGRPDHTLPRARVWLGSRRSVA